jgi:hypothetical protein
LGHSELLRKLESPTGFITDTGIGTDSLADRIEINFQDVAPGVINARA